MKRIFRDPVSGFIHLAGALLSIAATVFLTLKASSAIEMASFIIFGTSMILLFTASSVYHLITGPDWLIRACRRIDHSMIYILIAGTYTPIILGVFTDILKISYFVGIWSAAIVGTIIKIFFTGKLRTLSTLVYLLMGWSCIFAIYPLALSVGAGGIFFLILGGLMYTIGAVIYAVKKPNWFREFTFHDLFHVFVLLGAIMMFILIYGYISF